MSLQLDVRTGAQRPRLLRLPADRTVSDGPDAVEFAASAGLFLDDWQAWVLTEALMWRSDGRWSAFEVCLLVPRQNGKGAILEALELYHLFVLGTRLIVHSAHEFKTAREHFFRIKSLIENSPELKSQVKHIYEANGAESIVLKNDGRLKFAARSKGSGRGFSGDLIVLDEAYELPEAAIGAMGPTLSAMPNPQVWYTSSAPHADSHVLHGVRKRGLEGKSSRLFLAEWSNEPDVDPEDLDALASANPGYPHRLTPDNLEAEREMMRGLGDEYLRERLGVPSEEDSSAGVFPPGAWPGCEDESSTIAQGRRIALDVSPEMTWSSFAGAGIRADGLAHIELIKRQTGTGWVVAQAVEYAQKWGPLVIDPRGPSSALIEDLRKANVPLEEVPDGLFPKACALLQERVIAGTVRHIGQPPLDAAVAGAQIRTVGDSWRWSRATSTVDISPLVACTLAIHAAAQMTIDPVSQVF